MTDAAGYIGVQLTSSSTTNVREPAAIFGNNEATTATEEQREKGRSVTHSSFNESRRRLV